MNAKNSTPAADPTEDQPPGRNGVKWSADTCGAAASTVPSSTTASSPPSSSCIRPDIRSPTALETSATAGDRPGHDGGARTAPTGRVGHVLPADPGRRDHADRHRPVEPPPHHGRRPRSDRPVHIGGHAPAVGEPRAERREGGGHRYAQGEQERPGQERGGAGPRRRRGTAASGRRGRGRPRRTARYRCPRPAAVHPGVRMPEGRSVVRSQSLNVTVGLIKLTSCRT